MVSKRIEWIDLAKGMSIILVAYGHCGLSSVPFIGPWFGAFRMPFFFMVSGLLFRPEKYDSLSKFANRKWLTLIRPFIIFSLVVFVGFYFVGGERFDDLVNKFPVHGWGGIALWFIPVLLATEFLYLIVCNTIKKTTSKLIALFILAIIGTCLYYFNVPNIWNINFVFTAVLFYGIGSLNFKRINKFLEESSVKLLCLAALLCSLVSFIFVFNDTPEFGVNNLAKVWITIPAAFSGACMMFCVASVLSRWQRGVSKHVKFILKYFGKNSYIVLAFHQIIIMLLPVVGLHLNGCLARITMWIIVILIIELVTRYMPWILGREKKVNID